MAKLNIIKDLKEYDNNFKIEKIKKKNKNKNENVNLKNKKSKK